MTKFQVGEVVYGNRFGRFRVDSVRESPPIGEPVYGLTEIDKNGREGVCGMMYLPESALCKNPGSIREAM